ncbi:L,D-transpeptidase [Brevundimonas sp.]|uniref:L,D-transpeptidase n=1 Tax=Brevundimonas sp. TaxID=1871086 RepID=UPI003D11E420
MTSWVLETGDNQGLPFVLIDKVNAHVFAFSRDGLLLGDAPVLLGLARGDIAPPGIGDRPLSAIGPEDRITPSGRYVAGIGDNLTGKNVLWIDYAGALSLHRVVTGRAADRRLQRLTTPTSEDNRISYGCVNVPVAFFEETIEPAFRDTAGIVYILPETLSMAEVFPGV